jgi:tRNA pseudouridine38-40 synthase
LIAPIRYKLTLAYRGTHFHGWQHQTPSSTWKGPTPDGGALRTVQGVLAECLGQVVGHPVQVTGSSRTDAGVHAKGQVAHFDTTAVQIPPDGLRRAANSRLPGDIVIHSIQQVQAPDVQQGLRGFDAISDAVLKRYQYLIWNGENRNVFAEDLAFHRWQMLNIDAMDAAASHLVGTHDFASFARPGHGRESTVRTITSCSVASRGRQVVIGVVGTGFLWNQVRIIAGTLVEVGLGRFVPDDVPRMLAARDRRAAGQTAPPQGLYLQWIRHRDPVEAGGTIPQPSVSAEAEPEVS